MRVQRLDMLTDRGRVDGCSGHSIGFLEVMLE